MRRDRRHGNLSARGTHQGCRGAQQEDRRQEHPRRGVQGHDRPVRRRAPPRSRRVFRHRHVHLRRALRALTRERGEDDQPRRVGGRIARVQDEAGRQLAPRTRRHRRRFRQIFDRRRRRVEGPRGGRGLPGVRVRRRLRQIPVDAERHRVHHPRRVQVGVRPHPQLGRRGGGGLRRGVEDARRRVRAGRPAVQAHARPVRAQGGRRPGRPGAVHQRVHGPGRSAARGSPLDPRRRVHRAVPLGF
mmetsp:Transcript_9174/g.36999  ORF Transcript_9174/g.36999 Transcript_9174/m.36999 type:complete len:244 (-) Transcript_9174:504-1235(-)